MMIENTEQKLVTQGLQGCTLQGVDDDLHEYSKITNGGVVVDGERNVNAARWDFLFYPAKHSVK
jgi:hypothetical protein